MAKLESLGIKGIESVHWYVHDLERSADLCLTTWRRGRGNRGRLKLSMCNNSSRRCQA